MLDPQREIQALVDTFVADLSQLAKRIAIDQIKAAFEVGAPSLPPYTASSASSASSSSSSSAAPTFQLTSPSASPAPRGRGRRARESSDVEGLRNKLVASITETPGQRTEDINAALGTETQQIAPVLRKLVSEQRVRTEGARRGTRYFVNTGGEAMAGGQPSASGGEQTA